MARNPTPHTPPGDGSPTPPRRRMTHGARRAHILDVAQALFFSRGWDNVSVADILAASGMSKGGFYHHFSSKEDLVEDLVARFTQAGLAATQDACRADGANAVDRFNAFMSTSIRWKARQAPQLRLFSDAMLRPGNNLLFFRILTAVNAAVRPVLDQMIDDGVAEGSFDVQDVPLAGETILGLGIGRIEVARRAIRTAEAGDIDGATRMMNDRMEAEAALIDRILGLPEGSIRLSNPDEYRRMLLAIAGPESPGRAFGAASPMSGEEPGP